MRTTIDARYRVVTPLFCAGTDPSHPELRVPSFKGVLRFWWRALAWSRLRGDIGAVSHEESEIFGSTQSGQSRVSMRLDADSCSKPSKVPVGDVLTLSRTNDVVGEGARYLGYGVMEAFASRKKNTRAGQLARSCFRSPFDFTVRMRVRDLSEQDPGLVSLTDAMIALGVLGGMGARSRKGYGSLVIRSLRVNGVERWNAPRTMSDLGDEIARLRGNYLAATLPEFTALSRGTRHILLSSGREEPVAMLDFVGRELVRFRSWGHKGKILGNQIDSERQFPDDHDLMKKVSMGRQPRHHPRRIAFGLPHNYGKQPMEQVGPDDKKLDRRASPLFVHIHECHGTPVAVLSFLPARFLPTGRSDISVGGTRVPQATEDQLYRPIHDFLDRLLDAGKRKEPFTEAMELRS